MFIRLRAVHRRLPRLALASVLILAVTAAGVLTGRPSEAAPSSRCSTFQGLFSTTTSCPNIETTLWTGALGLTPRDVHYQTPLGTPPAGGWPAVVVWSPSFWGAEVSWTANSLFPAGAWYDTLQYKALLDNGYAVITPESHLEGFTFWDTNNPLTPWATAPDRYFTDSILRELGRGRFGPINTNRLFTTGMSSGGYMTSRMAIAYPGVFKAVAVQSGSYADCLGPFCSVPATLPSTHAPTLFLHGTADAVVPLNTMTPYRDRLQAQGIATRTVLKTGAGHEFLPQSPTEVLNWFRLYDPGH